MKLITGKELKFAAQNKIPVFYEERFYNPKYKYAEFNNITTMTKAISSGYFIGSSDIDPDEWDDNDYVHGHTDEGFINVYKIKGLKYTTNNKNIKEHNLMSKEDKNKVVLICESFEGNDYRNRPYLLLGETESYYVVHQLEPADYWDCIHYVPKADYSIEELDLSILPGNVQKVIKQNIKEILSS